MLWIWKKFSKIMNPGEGSLFMEAVKLGRAGKKEEDMTLTELRYTAFDFYDVATKTGNYAGMNEFVNTLEKIRTKVKNKTLD